MDFRRSALVLFLLAACPASGLAAEPASSKIVLVGGSSVYKPGEHEYLAGCAALADLLRQTPGIAPVVAVDWADKPEILDEARSVVMFFDGGDKHALLDAGRMAQVQKLADGGTGLVALHQDVDIPVDRGNAIRGLFGAAWEKGYSQRAHWVADFSAFPDHPIFRGVTPFKIDDGWLFRLRFVPELKGVAPLLRTVSPKAPVALRRAARISSPGLMNVLAAAARSSSPAATCTGAWPTRDIAGSSSTASSGPPACRCRRAGRPWRSTRMP
jgi:hypothetical protein